MKVLIFGGRGWIGQQFINIIKHTVHEYIVVDQTIRADDEKNVSELLDREKPTHVISFIGRTHGGKYSTIDYLELPGKLKENINDNLYSPLVLALLCREKNIHYSYLGTGCIFSSDDPREKEYTEESQPDFFGSSYSTVKGFTDRIMHMFSHVLNIRIRMPITNEDHPRNFITKIVGYEKICSIPNSMTVLPELLPLVLDMMNDKRTGTINLTNPGVISHNEILEMYKKYIDPDFTWKNFTLEEQDQLLLSKRSNNQLSSELLTQWFPNVNPIHKAVENCFKDWKRKEQVDENILNGHKTVIITGGCGAIGSHVVNYLKNKYRQTQFINIDALTYCGKKENIEQPYDNYVLEHGNICDMEFVKHVFYKYNPTCLIHLAAETHVDQSFGDSLKFTNTNVIGTHILLEVIKTYGKLELMIHMSTDEVYGSVNDEQICTEQSLFSPSNPYAASKAAAEMLCYSYIKSFKIPIIITRCNNAISRYQDPEKLIPKCIKCIREKVKIPIHGDGSSKRTFIHSVDIAKALETIVYRGEIGEIYNIGTEMEYTVLEVVDFILKIMKSTVELHDSIKYIEDRKFQDYRYCIDSSKLRKLGWKESISFRDAIKDIVSM